MKFSYSLALWYLTFVAAAPAKTDDKSTVVGPGFISIDIEATTADSQDHIVEFFRRDRSFFESELVNKLIYYTANIGVGTPPQNFQVTVDTGSSDFWIAASKEIATPYFNSTQSSTFHSNDTKFEIHYVKGSNTGTWATDKVTFGSVSVDDLPFGTVSKGIDLGGTIGIMGIGAMQNEAPVLLKTGPSYPNFPRKLKDQGHINKVAYSLYLNSLNSSSGTLLMGGVDKSRFSGKLYKVPVVSDRSLDVNLSGLKVNGEDLSSWDTTGITLDSGTSFTYLPVDAFSEIGDRIDGADFLGGLYFIDSTNIDWNQILEFDFSGAVIKVPLKSLCIKSSEVIKPGSSLDPRYDYVLGILSNTNSRGISLIGDSFLRSAYVVYDLEAWEIAIAQAQYDADYSDIQAITTSIPFAVKAPNLA